MLGNKARDLAGQLKAEMTAIKRLERQIYILDERLGTKDLLIGQLLHQKKKKNRTKKTSLFSTSPVV